jgi:putative phosphoesterase
MKIIFFSDIHGVPSTVEKLLAHADDLMADQLVLLGDILYHGPRNGVPGFYDPPKVAELLNARREQILAVRGNCDAEVDQMLLKFPIMSDYAELAVDGHRFFLTHGHLWNAENLPAIPAGTTLVHGHTHIPEDRMLECGIRIFNPGSISLPKQQTPQSFGFFDGKILSLMKL